MLLLSVGVGALWVVVAFVLAGIGVLVLNRGARLEPGWHSAHHAFWMGFAVVSSALLVWHFVAPVNGAAATVTACAGAAAWYRQRRWLGAWLRGGASVGAVVTGTALVIWIANHGLNAGGLDDYSYEFQALRWIVEYPVVPGLANLHGRLGFNQAHHLIAAMLAAGGVGGRVNHVFNGLFVAVFAGYVLSAVAVLARRGPSAPPATVFRALMIGPVVGLVLFGTFGPPISTLKADVLVTLLALYAGCLLLELAAAGDEQDRARWMALLVAVCAVSIAIKISAAVFSAIVGVAVLAGAAADGWNALRRGPLPVAFAIAVVLAIGVPARGILLSGYPMYPETIGAVDVDWRVPTAQANAELAYVTSSGRLKPTYDPAEVGARPWVRDWARATALTEKFTLVLPAVLVLLAAAAIGPRAASRGTVAAPVARASVVMSAASAAALLTWFMEAPAGRFAAPYAWLLAGSALVWLREGGLWHRRRSVAGVALAATAILVLVAVSRVESTYAFGLAVLVAAAAAWVSLYGAARPQGMAAALLCLVLGGLQVADRAVSHLSSGRWHQARALLWLTPDQHAARAPSRPDVVRHTRSGLAVIESRFIDYDTPLPNTPYVNPTLEARVPGRLAAGFRTTVAPDGRRFGYTVLVTETIDQQEREIVRPDDAR